ncbi:hypothetical protein A5707_11360 [Mycobacterium kyorinense]|uniref:Uncharacterized protein n=1 Tax=Mycobacterium kyorinense TaxID=487514 RepID=A0A1A2ZUT6_9MYCO|nr:hypothetical protein [Mycobacterium kyorinense]OBI53463.1 hypothetical protein A5707_11360 [Mycobacterium kyorinense]
MTGKVFNFEETHARMNRTVDLAAVLKTISAAELEFFRRWFDAFAEVNHKGAAGVGKALGVLVDAEKARREWAAARVRAEFDSMMAELPRPSLTDILSEE